ncbi:MAG: hypothetical protein AAFV98_22525 [Chloroflexota bacterium]
MARLDVLYVNTELDPKSFLIDYLSPIKSDDSEQVVIKQRNIRYDAQVQQLDWTAKTTYQFDREDIDKDYGFSPTIEVYISFLTKSSSDIELMVDLNNKCIFQLVNETNYDFIHYITDIPVIVRSKGKIYLTREYNYWTKERLAQLPSDFIMKDNLDTL